MEEYYLMVVFEQLVQEVNSLVADEALVFASDEAVPWLLLESTKDIVVLGIELDLVLVEVVKQVICPQNLGDLYELIRVAVAMEERLFPKDHRGKHGTQTPHVQAVIVLLEVDEELWPFKVPRRDSDVVLRAGVVKLGEAPVDEPQLSKKCQHISSDLEHCYWGCRPVPSCSHGRS